MITQTPPPAATFDEFTVEFLRRHTGRYESSVAPAFDRWRDEGRSDETFLGYLSNRGALTRVTARALLLAWRGGLDDRDARQLFDPNAVGLAVSKLAPNPAEQGPPTLESCPLLGSRLGRYTLKGMLGWGGFGAVYLSTHPTLRVPVAIKPVPKRGGTAPQALCDQLKAEARRQAAIHHPNVVRVWDYEDGDDPFLVLEYVPGENLQERVSHEPLSVAETFTLIIQMALALRAAWRAGIIHSDVKPANVLLAAENGYKLADFGLARCRRKFAQVREQNAPVPKLATRGSLNYMAPEQFENCHDFRSDIYALGLIAHYGLSGSPAVVGSDPDEVMLRHKRGSIEPLQKLLPDLRWDVSELIRRMTAVDPERRFQSYDDLISATETAFGLRLDPY